MSVWRALIIGAAGVAAAGCSLLISTDGLRSADADAGTTEGGTANEAGTDAGTDATSAEGGDGSAGPFCASLVPKPKFCADFDTGIVTDYGRLVGQPTLASSFSLSPSRSLFAQVLTNATIRNSQVVHDLPDAPSTITASLDVYVETYDPTHDVELFTVYLGQPTPKYCDLNIAIRRGVWSFSEYCEDDTGTPTLSKGISASTDLKLGRWTHLELSASFAAPRTFSFAIDGVGVLAAPLDSALAGGKVSVVMGIYYLQVAATTAKVHTDNVVLDYP